MIDLKKIQNLITIPNVSEKKNFVEKNLRKSSLNSFYAEKFSSGAELFISFKSL